MRIHDKNEFRANAESCGRIIARSLSTSETDRQRLTCSCSLICANSISANHIDSHVAHAEDFRDVCAWIFPFFASIASDIFSPPPSLCVCTYPFLVELFESHANIHQICSFEFRKTIFDVHVKGDSYLSERWDDRTFFQTTKDLSLSSFLDFSTACISIK